MCTAPKVITPTICSLLFWLLTSIHQPENTVHRRLRSTFIKYTEMVTEVSVPTYEKTSKWVQSQVVRRAVVVSMLNNFAHLLYVQVGFLSTAKIPVPIFDSAKSSQSVRNTWCSMNRSKSTRLAKWPSLSTHIRLSRVRVSIRAQGVCTADDS